MSSRVVLVQMSVFLLWMLISASGFPLTVLEDGIADSQENDSIDKFQFLLDLDEMQRQENWLFSLNLSNTGLHGEPWGQAFLIEKNNVFNSFDHFFLSAYTDSFDAVQSLRGRYSSVFRGNEQFKWRWNFGFHFQDIERPAFDRSIVLSAEQRDRIISRGQFDFLDRLRFGELFIVTIFDQFEESTQGISFGWDNMLWENVRGFFQMTLGFEWQHIGISYQLISKLKVNDLFCSSLPNGCIADVDFCPNDDSPSFNDPDNVNLSRDYCLLYSAEVPGDDEFDFILPSVSMVYATMNSKQEVYARAALIYSAADLIGTPDRLTVLGRPNAENDFIMIQGQISWERCVHCIEEKTVTSRLRLALQGQSSLGAVLPPQMLAPLGGSTTVRGYPESQVAADTVMSASVEYHWIVRGDHNTVTIEDIFLFIDVGYFSIEREGQLTFLTNSYELGDSSNTLAGIGAGVSMALGASFTTDATIGYPLKKINRLESISTIQDFTFFGPENTVEVGDTTVHLNIDWIF